jgi:hypothetical protein
LQKFCYVLHKIFVCFRGAPLRYIAAVGGQQQQQASSSRSRRRKIFSRIFFKPIFFFNPPVPSALSHLKTLHFYPSFISSLSLCCPLHPFQMIFSCLSSGHHLALAPAGAHLNHLPHLLMSTITCTIRNVVYNHLRPSPLL